LANTLNVFSGNANRELAEQACKYLGISLGDVDVYQFSDGETGVKLNQNIRGTDVFVFQPTCPPDRNLMELLILLDAAKRASAERVTAVIPYFGYARQDRKDQPRVAITAKLVANLIAVAGADRVLTMDLHSAQIQGFFDIPFDHLYAAPVLIDYFAGLNLKDPTVVAPDIGSMKMARAFAKRLDAALALIDKRRPEKDKAEVLTVIGDLKDKDVFIIDDMISTAGTVVQAAEAAREYGARNIYIGCTHAVLCGGALTRLEESPAREVVVTDTIPHARNDLPPKIKVLSVASLLGEAIVRTHEERSLSSLFV
jgi:ribose-phosphate pyrophosphokinase